MLNRLQEKLIFKLQDGIEKEDSSLRMTCIFFMAEKMKQKCYLGMMEAQYNSQQ